MTGKCSLLTAIILTRDEEHHIQRCIRSLNGVADSIVVVDSGSVDRTTEIASTLGARVMTNPWINYSTQLNWAIDQLQSDTNWVLRLDADEIVTPQLALEIKEQLTDFDDVDGIFVPRRMTFLGRPIRHGGIFPIQVLRLFRYGKGRCENRWMDEHIIVDGKTEALRGEIVDDNLNSLTWWTTKHNSYACREVVDILNLKYGFMPHETIANLQSGQQAGVKRWIKEKIYSRLPGGFRAFAYFFYRYFLRFGFLDGKEGAIFHVLQGFWYRYLVDAKLIEVRKYMRTNNVGAVVAIERVLGVKVV